jgi:hypothetical protein
MVEAVRGKGPLRPEKARQLGFEGNVSPLYRLYQAFRRSTPKPKVAGAYARLLVVPDNERATEMAQRFYAGESAYLSDTKWYELVVEADEDLLRGENSPASQGGEDELLGGPGGETPPSDNPPEPTLAPEVVRDPIPSLSRTYRESLLGNVWDVRAYRTDYADPDLLSMPWRMLRDPATGVWSFLIDVEHEVLNSSTLTPLDALLAELAHNAISLAPRDSAVSFSEVLAALRKAYAGPTRLDPTDLTARASLLMGDIARRFAGSADERDNEAYFNELTPSEREQILANAASTSPENPVGVASVVAGGRFLEFAGGKTMLRFFGAHPELFFDGKQWDRRYVDLDYGHPTATDEARSSLVRYYSNLLEDVVWLAGKDTTDLAAAPRARLLRAALALDLLTADMVPES